jgi:hypothetical protein
VTSGRRRAVKLSRRCPFCASRDVAAAACAERKNQATCATCGRQWYVAANVEAANGEAPIRDALHAEASHPALHPEPLRPAAPRPEALDGEVANAKAATRLPAPVAAASVAPVIAAERGPASPQAAARESTRAHWVLLRGNGHQVRCQIEHRAPHGYAVSVTFGREALLFETFPHPEQAVQRARAFREGLLRKGWQAPPPAGR